MILEAAIDLPVESPGIVVGGWGQVPHWGVYAALFLVSAGLLTLEVSLTRLFSFTIWYHFAYLTISVALLGFGSSGALIASFPQLLRRDGQRLLVAALITAAVMTVAGLVFLGRFPLEINNLTAKPLRFFLSLMLYYAIVGAPFLLAGFAVGVPFAAYPRLMGRLYFWDLFGAALGCVLVISLIERVGVPGLIVIAAALLLGGAGTLSYGGGNELIGPALAACSALLITLSGRLGNQVDIHVTSTKGLNRYAEAIKRDDVYSEWTALNRVDAFGWNHPSEVQFWSGIGTQGGHKGRLKTAHIMYDGSNGSDIYPFTGSFDAFDVLERHTLRTPYLIRAHPNVLVIGVGGGIDMLNAIKQGARHVTGAELQPKAVYLLKERLRPFTGGFYDRDDVTLVASEGRHFVRQTDQVFDLIQITAVDTFAAQATGAYVLAESYLYTVEAQEDYFKRLSSDGLLSMVVGDLYSSDELPPLATRLALIGYRALQRRGVGNPEDHILVIGSRQAGSLAQNEVVLVKKTPFTAEDVNTIRQFVAESGFMMLYAPAPLSPEPYALSVVLGGDEAARQRVLDHAWFRMDAVYDHDPFFYNVGKWSNMSPTRTLWSSFPGSFVGQLVLVGMLAQSVLLGAALIIVPLLRGAGEGLHTPGVLSFLGYFLALGVGFMFIEISFVQSFVLFLGSPTYALSVTIFSLLLFSSLGSLLSNRYVKRPEWALRRLVVILTSVVVTYTFALSRIFDGFLHLSLRWRMLIAVAAQMPMGLTLGMFMPLGMACVSQAHVRLVPWAWGINGVGSVIGTTLAVILAMSWGFPVVAYSAAGLYITGTALLLRAQQSASLAAGVRPAS